MISTRDPVEEFFTTLVRTFRRAKPAPLPEPPVTFAKPLPPELRPPTPPKRPKRLPDNVVDFRTHPVVMALRKNGGYAASNRELARLMDVSDGESSKRWREVKDQLDVCRIGKRTTISLRN